MTFNPSRRTAILVGAGAAVVPSAGAARSASQGMESQPNSPIAAASTAYLDAWRRKDLAGIGALLHPQIHFKSPTAEIVGRGAYLAATAKFFPLYERLDKHAQFTSGDQAMFAYDFVCPAPIGVCPTAEWIIFEGGLIRESEVYFDARPFEALARAQAARSQHN